MKISGWEDAHGFGPLLAPVVGAFGAFSLLDEVNVGVYLFTPIPCQIGYFRGIKVSITI
jgi:hypothetical protein